ncbi:MAG: glycerol-3-phosphate dehydrogenase [Coleofasciculus sp. D1-CHI-01]|uniref:glycerol-3-phosphate dehydrogenase n=1 Tax=Coleofasciculus sp. D1-CHI-01 TaxID=3068482 RepID=UPI0032F302C4
MRDFQTIQSQTYDLIVIGGGINGAGVVRDAALRGLKTILLEKADFCGGTTSWSTRLVHGGLRYLEYFEFALVRESLREREILLHTAPHLVKPLMLTIPIYSDRSRPYWKIQAGMLLYDILSFEKTLLPHRMLPKKKFKQLFRHIDPDGLVGGAQYYDGQVAYAERLALENIICAEQAGATVLNYTEVTQLQRQEGRITSITCKDALTGEEFTVQGSDRAVVVNTAGPWVDKVCHSGVKNGQSAPIGEKKKIGPTKGSHIIVPPFPGAPETTLYVEAKTDGRPFFIVPWLGMYLIGTTDLRHQGALDSIKADNEEIDYLLTETNRILPTAQLSRQDVKFTYAGVRPLPNAEGKKPGSVTRSHILYDHTPEGVSNLISLIGGKITTYRQVGEEMVNKVYRKLGRSAPPCPTYEKPLPGAILPSDPRLEKALQDYRTTLPLATIHHLFDVYGAKALDILALTDEEPELAEAITPNLPDIKAQIIYAVQSEFARTLVDIARRRTSLAMHTNYGFDILPVLTDILSRYGGWSSAECDRQVEDYRAFMEANCIPDYAMATQKETQTVS